MRNRRDNKMVITRRDELGRILPKPRPPITLLKKLYTKKQLSPSVIGSLYTVNMGTVYRWLHDSEIPLRCSHRETTRVNLNISETDKAYLAGYLDGDGSIYLSEYKGPKSKYPNRVGLSSGVSFLSANKNLAKVIHNIIGGSLFHDERTKKGHYRIVFSRQTHILALLKTISPYLKLKREQAELMIKYCTLRLEARRQKGVTAPISDECFKIAKEIRSLNANEKTKEVVR